MRLRQLASLFALFTIIATAACSSSEETGDSSQDAIRSSEANDRQFSLREHVLDGEAASAESAEKLGIKTWDVYAGSDPKTGFVGTVSYASDADGDVKFAFVVDMQHAAEGMPQASLLVFDKAGNTRRSSIDSEGDAGVLLDEIGRLAEMVSNAQPAAGGVHPNAMANGTACALRVAGIGLAIVAGVTVGVVVGGFAAAATSVAIVGTTGAEAYAAVVASTYLGAAAGGAVGVASFPVALGRDYWKATTKACTGK